jgi:hypothetical protein
VFYDFGVAAPLYGVNAIPTTYFIDKEGCIVSYKVGMLSAEELRQGIDLIR